MPAQPRDIPRLREENKARVEGDRGSQRAAHGSERRLKMMDVSGAN